MTIPISRKGDGLKRALFLCDDNFLASRFCEELFNSLVRSEGLNWQAVSRAISPDLARRHGEPMAAAAVEFLRGIGAAPVNHRRLPLGATAFDFEMSYVAIAIAPHGRHDGVSAAWPDFSTQFEFWTIDAAMPVDSLLGELTVSLEAMLDQMLGRVPEPRMLRRVSADRRRPSVKLGPRSAQGDELSDVRATKRIFEQSTASSTRAG